MADLVGQILKAMEGTHFISAHYPILTNGGLHDEDVLIHSLGCSVWNTLGHELGYMAVVECPAPGTHGADIRSDSGWFDDNELTPLALVEFERYDGSSRGQSKLNEKLCNLIGAAQRWNHPPKVLILSAWSQGIVSAPDTDALKKCCYEGIRISSGSQVTASSTIKILFNRFLFEKSSSNGLTLKHVRSERLM